MTLIIHRCTVCQHPDLFHNSRDDGNHESCSYGSCSARRHEFGPSEALPSWDSSIGGSSALIEEVVQPGSSVQGYPGTLCDCTSCRELADSLSYAA